MRVNKYYPLTYELVRRTLYQYTVLYRIRQLAGSLRYQHIGYDTYRRPVEHCASRTSDRLLGQSRGI